MLSELRVTCGWGTVEHHVKCWDSWVLGVASKCKKSYPNPGRYQILLTSARIDFEFETSRTFVGITYEFKTEPVMWMWAGIAQSVQRLATGWTLRGSNPGEGRGENFRICPDRPWGPPSLLYSRYRVFPGGKEGPGDEADLSPPSSAVVKKE